MGQALRGDASTSWTWQDVGGGPGDPGAHSKVVLQLLQDSAESGARRVQEEGIRDGARFCRAQKMDRQQREKCAMMGIPAGFEEPQGQGSISTLGDGHSLPGRGPKNLLCP